MRRVALGCVALALAACSTTADSTEAGVRLTITYDAVLAIDAVHVRAFDGEREVVEATRAADKGTLHESETLPLVFDGAPDGAKVRIVVEALAMEGAVGTEETTATLRRGRFVDAEVHFAGSAGGGGTDAGADAGGGNDSGVDAGADAAADSGGSDAGADAAAPECMPNGTTRSCSGTDVGECKKGKQFCIDGEWSTCEGEIEPTAETCPPDGKDQDCSGVDDDGSNGCGGVCTLANAPGDWCDAPETAAGDADDCEDDSYKCDGLNDVTCIEHTPGLVKEALAYGDVQSDSFAAIAVDSAGARFATGFVTKDPGGTTEVGGESVDTYGGSDVLVVRVDPGDGSVVWAAGGGGVAQDEGFAVAIASDESAVHVTGAYAGGTATFDGSVLADPDSTNSTYFLATYEATDTAMDGIDLLWAIDAGASGADAGRAVAAASDGSVYVAGMLGDVSADTTFAGVSGASATLVRPCNGAQQMFLAKYNASGQVVWVTGTASSSASDDAGAAAYGIALDAAGNVYVTGSFKGLNLRFCNATASRVCPENACPETLTSQDYTGDASYRDDLFLAKYDSDGNVQWATRAGNVSSAEVGAEVGAGLATDGTNVYVTGSVYGATTMAFCELPDAACAMGNTIALTSLKEMFVAAFSASSGAFQWARHTTGGTSGGAAEGVAIAADSDGSVRVIGFSDPEDSMFEPLGFGEASEACFTQIVPLSTFSGQSFVARYEANGDLRWAHQIGHGGGRARGVTVLPGGESVVAGAFFTGTFCDDPAGCSVMVTTASGSQDGCFARFAR